MLDRWGTAQSPLRTRVEGMSALSSGELTARYEQVDRWRSRMLALFTEVDIIVCPVNIGPAPVHNAFERPSATYTQAFNLTGWPSTVVRAGTSGEGLPIGVQVVAPPWREDISLAEAARN